MLTKLLMAGLACIALTGCETFGKIAPQTTAGFEANGIIGAVDGASGAIVAICETVDGDQIRVAVDAVGDLAGQGDLVERVRKARKDACAKAGAVRAWVDDFGHPVEIDAPDDPAVPVPAAEPEVAG